MLRQRLTRRLRHRRTGAPAVEAPVVEAQTQADSEIVGWDELFRMVRQLLTRRLRHRRTGAAAVEAPVVEAQTEPASEIMGWDELQEWFRAQPLMTGFFRGRTPGWKHLPLLMEMYRRQALHMGQVGGVWFMRLPWLAALAAAGIGAIIGTALHFAGSDNHRSTGGLEWYVLVPVLASFLGVVGLAGGVLLRGLIIYGQVMLPVVINQYNVNISDWCPVYRAVQDVPRLAYVAVEEKVFYGPQGGGVLTATHGRLSTRTKNLRQCKAEVVYELGPQTGYMEDTPGRAMRALKIATDEAAEAIPKGGQERRRRLLTQGNFIRLALGFGALASMLVIASRTGAA